MNKKGFTLIELIVVFVIIAVTAALIAPNIRGWLPRYRLRSATREIVSTMRTAQMKAVSNRMDYQVDFNVGTNSYVLQYDSGGFKNDGPVWKAPSEITVNNTLPGGKALFDSASTCPNGGGSITLSYQKGGVIQDQKRILLNAATGRARIQ
jgi:prepilin-type N-terminal cleavage/methylation domain-containing protein